MVQTIAGGKVGSLKNLKQTLKAGGGPLSWVPKEGAITVRFLTEPEDWFGFYEHYDETARKSYPCVEGDCPGCATDTKRTFRYVANALDTEKDKVIALLLPKSLANRLTARYERYDTLMDRDYELFRTGSALDTEYDLNPEAPKKRAVAKYELLDLGDILQQVWDAVWGETNGDDDEDEKPTRRSRSSSARKGSAASRRKARDEEEDDDEEDEEDEDEEDDEDFDDEDDGDDDDTDEDVEEVTLESLEEMGLPELKQVAEDYGIPVKPEKGKTRISSAALRQRIIDELELEAEDDEEEGDDDEVYSEDELTSFTITELRELARDFKIKTVKKTKADLVEAIMEAQG